jgi:hypothetical protein
MMSQNQPADQTPATTPVPAPAGISAGQTVDYVVDHLRAHDDHVVVVLDKDPTIQLGQPGFVGFPMRIRMGLGNPADATPFQIGTLVRVTVEPLGIPYVPPPTPAYDDGEDDVDDSV